MPVKMRPVHWSLGNIFANFPRPKSTKLSTNKGLSFCSGGFFTFVGGKITGAKAPIKLEGYVLPLNYDSSRGLSSGFLAQAGGEFGGKKSLIQPAVEVTYNYRSSTWTSEANGFFGKFQRARYGAFEGGLLLDQEGNFGLYGGTFFGAGVYGKPSLSGCK